MQQPYIFRIIIIVITASFSAGCNITRERETPLNEQAARALVQRVLPRHFTRFEVEYIPQENGRDVFELESRKGQIILRGNNGVSVASALNYWLKEYAHCDISWNGVNLNIPRPLPMVPKKVRKVTPHQYRHYFNYCTLNYTASWWGWERWQWEIDFMALNGINMPLAMTGQNAVWDRVYRSLGLSRQDMDSFFTGPAYFMWFWAGNIDGLNGPLPQSWMESHEALEKKILQRERELGMTPILPAFSGHVPPALQKHFPNAKIDRVNWEGRFADTYLLDPEDSLFQVIGDRFMEEQEKTFGPTAHLYGADTFNEMLPPHEDSSYLRKIGRAVYRAMAAKDPEAVWVMQGWLFWDKRGFWQPERIKSYLSEVPDDRLVILDLFADEQPIWDKTDAFFGKKWIWCMLHNFGGRNPLFGNLSHIAKEPADMLRRPDKGRLSGIGIVPEGIEQNPVVYSLMLHHVWNDAPADLDQWLPQYAHNRYGRRNTHTEKAWNILHRTVYSEAGSYEPAITARPTFEKSTDWAITDLYYNPAELVQAWSHLMIPAKTFRHNDCYQFDLVTVARQVLANYSKVLQQQFAADYRQRNMEAFSTHAAAFLELIDDMDRLMATRQDFLLGKWLNDAKAWGATPQEKALYEMNARDLVTLWGGKDAVLHDYANKQWAGLFSGFYKKRWERFIAEATAALAAGRAFDQAAFDEKIKAWEWQWVNNQEPYPDQPAGDPVAAAARMYSKYARQITETYQRYPQFTKN